MEPRKSEYFVADEPVEFLLLAMGLAAVSILAIGGMIIAAVI